MIKIIGLTLLLTAALIQAQKDSESKEPDKEAMEIGGLVTVDHNPNVNNFEEPSLTIGTVELSANVHVKDSLLATVVILAEEDLSAISIDQAVATWNTRIQGLTIYADRHYFLHGLLTTRLISDPLILNAVEIAGPGFTATFGLKRFTLGLGAGQSH